MAWYRAKSFALPRDLCAACQPREALRGPYGAKCAPALHLAKLQWKDGKGPATECGAPIASEGWQFRAHQTRKIEFDGLRARADKIDDIGGEEGETEHGIDVAVRYAFGTRERGQAEIRIGV